MANHKEQRVGVLVDVSNMYHSAKHLFSRKVNYKEVLVQAVSGRKLIRATAYVIKNENNKDEALFFKALGQQGFEVKTKDLQIFPTGDKKGDWDVGIVIDAIKLADKLDVIILVSGDGDYIPAISYLQNNKGCLIEVMAFRQTTSAKLVEIADNFTDLGGNPKFLI